MYSGFYKLSVEERRARLASGVGLESEDVDLLCGLGDTLESLDRVSENVIGELKLPLSVAPTFSINGRLTPLPMATEESSVVAAASNGARILGDISTTVSAALMHGELFIECNNTVEAVKVVQEAAEEAARTAAAVCPGMTARGGGFKGFRRVEAMKLPAVGDFSPPAGVLVLFDFAPCAAMGANAINTTAEALGDLLAAKVGGECNIRILSNKCPERTATASAVLTPARLVSYRVAKSEEEAVQIIQRIATLYSLAVADAYRCATHNKGILNGVLALATATGQDTRAITVANDVSRPLTEFTLQDNALHCSCTLHTPVGAVGGVLAVHGACRGGLTLIEKSLATSSKTEVAQALAGALAAVGLAQNVAALLAIVNGGIQRGHMRLHAANLLVAAGVPSDRLDDAVRELRALGAPSSTLAAEIAKKYV